MARKDRTLAGFGDVAGDNQNQNNNANNDHNDNANNSNNINNSSDVQAPDGDYLDTLLGEQKKKQEPILTGVYLQPDIAKILDRLGKKGGRGAKSKIVNEALRKLFMEKDLL